MTGDEPLRDLEKYWQDKIKHARTDYEAALAQTRKILADQKGCPNNPPDGPSAIHAVLSQEAAARNEYMRVLRIFTDVAVYGKKPELP